MDEGIQILKKQIHVLPKEIRDYVINGDWSDKLDIALADFNLQDVQKKAIANELLLVLVGLELFSDLRKNIESEARVHSEITDSIVNIISNEVLGELDAIVRPAPRSEEVGKSGVGNEFEQIILNQAKAMRPAVPPQNLPTSDGPKVATDYKPGEDPYREPAV